MGERWPQLTARRTARQIVHVLTAILLKQALGVGGNDALTNFWIDSCDGLVYLHGLDIPDDPTWKLRLDASANAKNFVQEVYRYHDECAEYIAVMSDRVSQAWGADSADAKRWLSCVEDLGMMHSAQDLGVSLDYKNRLHFGWPVKSGERVMFRREHVPAMFKRDDDGLLPGTILENCDNSCHEPLDHNAMAYTFRWLTPDDGARCKLSDDERNSDCLRIRAKDVRSMNATEQKQYQVQERDKEEVDIVRSQSYTAFFIGDVVRVYDREVHYDVHRGSRASTPFTRIVFIWHRRYLTARFQDPKIVSPAPTALESRMLVWW